MDRVDWIPVNILADIIVELAGAAESHTTDGASGMDANGTHTASGLPTTTVPVYHAVNPKAIDWAELVPTITKYLGQSVKVVSWGEWMDALQNSMHDATVANLKQNPALKLLDFFQSIDEVVKRGERWPVMETRASARKSPTMASLEPVGEEWMKLWLRQWKF